MDQNEEKSLGRQRIVLKTASRIIPHISNSPGNINESEPRTLRSNESSAKGAPEDLLQLINNNFIEIFYVFNPDARTILHFGPGFKRITGKEPPCKGDRLIGWYSIIHLSDRDRVVQEYLKRSASGGREINYRITNNTGSTRWIRDRFISLDNRNSKQPLIAGLIEDITDLITARESERLADEKLSSVFGMSPDALFILTKSGEKNSRYLRRFHENVRLQPERSPGVFDIGPGHFKRPGAKESDHIATCPEFSDRGRRDHGKK